MEEFFYFDGPWDTTVRPPTAERLRQREADRANIQRIVAWANLEQIKLNARRHSQISTDDELDLEFDIDTDDDTGLGKNG